MSLAVIHACRSCALGAQRAESADGKRFGRAGMTTGLQPLGWAAASASVAAAASCRRSLTLQPAGRSRIGASKRHAAAYGIGAAVPTSRSSGKRTLAFVVGVYLLLSTIVYGVFEGWTPSDCIYFSITALFTVGYGDLSLKHPFSRLFFCLDIIFALVFLATRLSSSAQQLVEREAAIARKSLQRQLKLRADAEPEEGLDIFDAAASKRRLRWRFGYQLLLLVVFLALATFISFRALGLESFCNAVYFSVVTLTTVGFGDIVPKTMAAKWAVSLLCLVGVPIFGNTIAGLVSLIYGERQQRHIDRRLADLTTQKLMKMRQFVEEMQRRGLQDKLSADDTCACGEHRISQFEFCCFLLVQNNVISMKDVEAICTNFQQLDLSKDGYLWSKDVLAWELRRILTKPTEVKSEQDGTDDSEALSHDRLLELRESFDALDTDRSGYIDVSELASAMRKLDMEFPDDAAQDAMKDFDLDGDGKITFREYVQVVRKRTNS